jgi:hypothetical protein
VECLDEHAGSAPASLRCFRRHAAKHGVAKSLGRIRHGLREDQGTADGAVTMPWAFVSVL